MFPYAETSFCLWKVVSIIGNFRRLPDSMLGTFESHINNHKLKPLFFNDRAMNKKQFGTAETYFNILKTLQTEGIPNKHIELLQAHFNAANHTATWAQLAKAVGYANGNAVNLQYGRFASRVASLLGVTERPNGFWLFVLVDWAEDKDQLGHTAYVLRRPVIEALERFGIVKAQKTLNYWVIRGRPDQNGDFGFIKQNEIDEWRTKKPPSERWRIGDRLFFWASSPRRELISLGEFLGETDMYTSNMELIYRVRYLSPVLRRPLTLATLRADINLKDAIFLKQGPAMSVVSLSEGEGQHLYRLLVSNNPDVAGTWPDIEDSRAAVSDVDIFALEGERRLVQHFRRERSKSIVEYKKTSVMTLTGALACEVCDFDFKKRYGYRGNDFCEVHHRRPLSASDDVSVTHLEDLAIVCSNCHRILHRFNCELSVEDLKRWIESIQSSDSEIDN